MQPTLRGTRDSTASMRPQRHQRPRDPAGGTAKRFEFHPTNTASLTAHTLKGCRNASPALACGTRNTNWLAARTSSTTTWVSPVSRSHSSGVAKPSARRVSSSINRIAVLLGWLSGFSTEGSVTRSVSGCLPYARIAGRAPGQSRGCHQVAGRVETGDVHEYAAVGTSLVIEPCI